MPRHTALLFAMATLSATAAVSLAQTASPAVPSSSTVNSQTMQAQPAPIERAAVTATDKTTYTKPLTTGQTIAPGTDTANVQATSGIFLRVGKNSSVNAVSVTPENTELRVTQGVANISVHLPVAHAQILVDLPGGQTALVKDGFYTFNAETNTIRVLKGEAFAYPGNNQKSIKIKEDHALVFGSPHTKAFEFDPFEARADLIPYDLPPGSSAGSGTANYTDDGGDYGYGGGYAGYGGGYGFPYGGFGFGSFYDSPYGYYPFGLGLYGLGFYGGGFYGGGFYGGGYGGYYGGGYRGYGGGRNGYGGRGPRAGGGGSGGFHGGGGVRGSTGSFRGGGGGGGFHGGGGGVGGGGGGGFHGGGGGGGHR